MNGNIFDMYAKGRKSANLYDLINNPADESYATLKAKLAVFITYNMVVKSSKRLKTLNQNICDAVREQRKLYKNRD